MWASIVDRVELSLVEEQSDGVAVGLDDLRALFTEFVCGRNLHELAI
jgi:hypothetical protein